MEEVIVCQNKKTKNNKLLRANIISEDYLNELEKVTDSITKKKEKKHEEIEVELSTSFSLDHLSIVLTESDASLDASFDLGSDLDSDLGCDSSSDLGSDSGSDLGSDSKVSGAVSVSVLEKELEMKKPSKSLNSFDSLNSANSSNSSKSAKSANSSIHFNSFIFKDPQFLYENDSINSNDSILKKRNEFIIAYLNEINEARFNLIEYSKKLKNSITFFRTNILESSTNSNQSSQEYLKYKNKNIQINNGQFILSEFLNSLAKSNFNETHKNISFSKLKIIEDLKMPFPKDIKNWKDENYIKKQMEKIGKKNKRKYRLSAFFLCNSNHDGEIAALMNIIYKENGIGDYIFNNRIKYIGINIMEFDQKSYMLYLNFAE
jgi:hypothetical protein